MSLVCLLLFVPFSAHAHATDDINSSLNFTVQLVSSDGVVHPSNLLRPLTAKVRYEGDKLFSIEFPQSMVFCYTTNTENYNQGTNKIIVQKGDGFTFNVGNVLDTINYYDSAGNEISFRNRVEFNPTFTVKLFSSSGSLEYITPTNVTKTLSNGRFSFSVEVPEVPFDVYYFQINMYETSFPFGGSRPSSYSSWKRNILFDDLTSQNIKIIPEEKGLLTSMLDLLTELFNKISEGFNNVINSILELPSKIAQAMRDVLSYMFVPSDEYIQYGFQNFDDILTSKFGVLWEVPEVIIDFCTDIYDVLSADEDIRVIDFPIVSIPLGNGVVLEFGGWKVSLYNSDFSFVYDAIWMISAFIGTILFINGLRKRYDKLLGEDD